MKTLHTIVIMALITGFFLTSMTTYAQSPEPPQPPQPTDTMRRDEQGNVRVIVTLRVAEDDVSLADVPTDTIAMVQQRVLDRLTSQASVASDTPTVSVEHQYRFVPAMALTINADLLAALQQDPDVATISEDELAVPTLSESAPMIGADVAWDMNYTGKGTVVAVIDTGVDAAHEFLHHAVVSEACYSTTNGSQSETLCPNGQEEQIGTGAGTNCDTDIAACVHGTHVAGVVAGHSSKMSGIAPDANIIAVQVFTLFTSTDYCGSNAPCVMSYTSDQIAALEHVYMLRDQYNIAAVNMSLGSGSYNDQTVCDEKNPAYTDAVNNLVNSGIAVIASSGNVGLRDGIGYPACMSNVVSVGAAQNETSVASFSNSVDFLDLLAPGTMISSSVPGGEYATMQGTSMASPHVAGAWALMKEYQPEATVASVLQTLTEHGTLITDSKNGVTTPLIQLAPIVTDGVAPSVTMDVATAATHVAPSNMMTYTLTVQNTGVVDAHNIALNNTLPQGTTFVAASNGGTYNNNTRTINWAPLTIERDGDDVTRQVFVKVTEQTTAATPAFTDFMEDGIVNWTTASANMQDGWGLTSDNPHSGRYAWFANNVSYANAQTLAFFTPVALPAHAELRFWHNYNIEPFFDGGVVEISTDNGTTWHDLSTHMTTNGYNGEVNVSNNGTTVSIPAFNGTSNGYMQTRVDLSNYANKAALIRFRMLTDTSGSEHGWYVDDVMIVRGVELVDSAQLAITGSTISLQDSVTIIVDPTEPAIPPRVEPEDPPVDEEDPPVDEEDPPVDEETDNPYIITPEDERDFIFNIRGFTTMLNIPTGSVSETVRVNYSEIDLASSYDYDGGKMITQRAFVWAAYQDNQYLDGFTFEKPITITLDYPEQYTVQEHTIVTEQDCTLRLFKMVQGLWVDVASGEQSYTYDTTMNHLMIPMTQTGTFIMACVQPTVTAQEHRVYLAIVTR